MKEITIKIVGSTAETVSELLFAIQHMASHMGAATEQGQQQAFNSIAEMARLAHAINEAE